MAQVYTRFIRIDKYWWLTLSMHYRWRDQSSCTSKGYHPSLIRSRILYVLCIYRLGGTPNANNALYTSKHSLVSQPFWHVHGMINNPVTTGNEKIRKYLRDYMICSSLRRWRKYIQPWEIVPMPTTTAGVFWYILYANFVPSDWLPQSPPAQTEKAMIFVWQVRSCCQLSCLVHQKESRSVLS